MFRCFAILLALTLSLMGAAQAHAAAGDLDPTFSGDGVQTTNFFGGYSQVHGVAVQRDGKTVAAGEVSVGSNPYPEFSVARYDTDGSLDTTFSDDGIQTVSLDIFGAFTRAVAIQPDGKIVAAGETDPGHGGKEFAVVRFNRDGSLDTSFSGDGIQTTAVGPSGASVHANAVALASGGKIVVAGDSSFDGGGGFAVVRYNRDGSLDTSFSDDGVQITGSPLTVARSVAVQTDGRIVAAGWGVVDGRTEFALARYNDDGSLDPSFAGDGLQMTGLGLSDYASSVVLQVDGRIVVGGGVGKINPRWFNRFEPTVVFDFGIARYNSDGSLDETFSEDGIRVDAFDTSSSIAELALQADGKILAAGGNYQGAAAPQLALARYDGAGALDTTFSGDGKVTGGVAGYGQALALQPDGKAIVGGVTRSNEFLLARYKTEANAPGPRLTAYPASIEFDSRDRATGASGELLTTVTNSGTGDVTISGVSVGGSADFERLDGQGTDCAEGTVLAVDETCRIRARFDPSAAGPRAASVTLASNAPDLPVSLTGDGLTTELTAGPASLGFGDRDIGEGPTAESASTVTNTGTERVTITGVSVAGPDAAQFERVSGQVTDCDEDTTLDAGDSCEVRARFDPASTGAKSATATVASDAPDVSIALSGEGRTAPATQPEDPPRPQPTSRPPLTCAGKKATIVVAGPGKVTGTGGDDVIVGTAGRDRIDGAGGDDVICAGGAADRVSGGEGDDRIYGQDGNDRLLGRAGNDRLSGGDGFDREHGGRGNDRVSGGAGNDSVSGNDGDDSVTGGSGRDRIYGREGDDRLLGMDQWRDKLNGGTGVDRAISDARDAVRKCETP